MKHVGLILIIALAGCMVGPRYCPPITLIPENYTEQIGTNCVESDLTAWWEQFHDPCLNKLLAQGLRANFDLLIAIERMAQFKAQYFQEFANILPEFRLDGTATRSKTSQSIVRSALFPPVQNFFQAGVDALWEIDVFGKLRRRSRAAYYTWEAAAEDVRNVRILLLAQIAITYVNISALQQKKELLTQRISLQDELLRLSQSRLEAGLEEEQSFAKNLALYEEDKALLATAKIALKQAIYSLATLLGQLPECLLEEFQSPHPILEGCGKVPVGLPADLLRRRPDIRSAERNLAAATEYIGVAVAELFPTFSLTGSSTSFSSNPLQGANYGYASNSLGDLFKSISKIWGIGIFTQMPIFDFGRRYAHIKVQQFLKNQAFLQYEKSVVAALQEVEGSLSAYYHETERMEDLQRRLHASGRVLELTSDLFQAGLVALDQVMQKKIVWLDNYLDLVDSKQLLASNLISVYKALGGGWSCSTMP